jgi:putative ABC transport system permease protein
LNAETFFSLIRQNCIARDCFQTKPELFPQFFVPHEEAVVTPMENIWNDVKHSLQMFFKNPGFTIAAAVAALALGIGANTAIFSVVNAVLLKPLIYPNADRIVEFLSPSSVIVSNQHNVPEFHFFHRQTSVFQEVAAYDDGGPGFNITGDRPQQVHGLHVTEGYFRLFGAPVILGHTFTPQEDAPTAAKWRC